MIRAACWAALAWAASAPALAGATPVALYPLDGRGLSREAVSHLQKLVVRAAFQVSDDEEAFEPREPMLVQARCGAAGAAREACLARAAEGGALVFGTAEREGDDAIVTLRLIDANGRVSRPAWFRQNLGILGTGPAAQAVRELARQLADGLRGGAAR
jgi:hypothetical protein